jgi:4-diphosphocytidyl-2-C-methyl-D-erythritol kinase
MARIEARAPAKINLCLHLTGLRDDGYHLLESLVVFADVGDVLRVSPSDELSLTVDGPFAEGVPTDDANLVLKAACRLRDLRGVSQGAQLHLTKYLPHGGGIGGGSSDAACAIHLLATLWQVPALTSGEALPLGADVPVCLCAPHATEMRGIGENLRRAPFQPSGWLVLVNPRVMVPTGKVFALHDALYPFSPLGMASLNAVTDKDHFETWLLGQRNDLTKVTTESSIAPVVSDVLEELRQDAQDADMSGSGSTCWGYFASAEAAHQSADRIARAHPDWWVKAARILP